MATSLGSLVVSLGLDAAQYTAGLSKAERDAQKFARNVRSAVLEVGKILGGLAIGNEILQATKEIIAEAAALNDLADATGSTVESLSRLTNQAKIAGTDLATLQQAIFKLSAGMAGTGEDSTKAKEALKLLGITTRDPAQAMQEIAREFDKYSDGVNKVGLAVALFGKQGAGMVAVLKDIANLQDVAATTTTKQAEEAEKLEQAFRRLSVEATGFKNAILSSVVPALNDLIANFRLAREAGENFFGAMLRSGTNIDTISDQIKRAAEEVAKTKQAFAASSRLGLSAAPFFADQADVDAAIAKYNALIAIRNRAILQGQGDNADQISRRIRGKPEAPFIAAGGGAAAKAAKERISDTQRLIESLEKQLQGTLELNDVDTARIAIFDLLAKGATDLTAANQALILDYANQILASKELKKAEEERRKIDEQELRLREAMTKSIEQSLDNHRREAQQIVDGNEAIKEQIAFLRGGEEAVRAITDARIAENIAIQERILAGLQINRISEDEIKAVEATIAAYRERQALLKQFDLAKQFEAEKRAAEDFARSISDSFSSAFEGFISGTRSAKDAFRAFVADIQSQLVRLALRNVMDSILGVKSGGPDAFSVIAKLLGSFAGAGGGGLGYGTIGSAIPIGPYPYANGTDFHPGGAAMVGEHGPEVLNLPRGAQVIPMNKWRGGGHTMTFNINVLPGASTASVRQAKAQLRDAVMSAVRDR